MTTPELPPLPRYEKDFHRMRESVDGAWCHFRTVEARERILQARIAELTSALSDREDKLDALTEYLDRL